MMQTWPTCKCYNVLFKNYAMKQRSTVVLTGKLVGSFQVAIINSHPLISSNIGGVVIKCKSSGCGFMVQISLSALQPAPCSSLLLPPVPCSSLLLPAPPCSSLLLPPAPCSSLLLPPVHAAYHSLPDYPHMHVCMHMGAGVYMSSLYIIYNNKIHNHII